MCIRDRYGGLWCFPNEGFDAPISAYYEAAKNKPQVMSEAVSYTHLDVYKRQGYGNGYRLKPNNLNTKTNYGTEILPKLWHATK